MPCTCAGYGTTHAVYAPGVTCLNTAGSPCRTTTHCDAPGPAAASLSDSSVIVCATIAPLASHALATPTLPFVAAATTSSVTAPGSTVRSIVTTWPLGTSI